MIKIYKQMKNLLIFLVALCFCALTNKAVGQNARVYSLEYERNQEKELVQQERSLLLPEYNLEKLKGNLKSTNEMERLDAVEMTGYFPESNLISEVENLLLSDQSAAVRQQCAQTLKLLDAKQSIPALISALDDTDRNVRIFSALALAALGEKEKCVEFANILWKNGNNDNSWFYCQDIFRDAATSTAINNLVDELNCSDQNIAVGAAICLAQIEQSTKAISFLRQSLYNSDKYIRMAALRGLAYIGNETSLELVKSCINDENNLVRERAIRILNDYGVIIDDETTLRAVTAQTYDKEAAILYAATWWNKRNSAYYSDEGTKDCANFVSQCLIEGGLNLRVPGYAYNSSGCIINCDCLHKFLINEIGCTHERRGRAQSSTNGYSSSYCQRGDIVIYGDVIPANRPPNRGCNTEGQIDYWQHSVIVTSANDVPRYNAHSENQENQSVPNAYTANGTGKTFRTADFYHFPTTIAPPPPTSIPIISWNSSSGEGYVFGDNLTISWQSVPGAAKYCLIIKQLAGEPNPNVNNGDVGYNLKSPYNSQDWVYNSTSTGVYFTGTSAILNSSGSSNVYSELNYLTVGKYVKLYVQAQRSDGTGISEHYTYFLIKPKVPTLNNNLISVKAGQTINLSWLSTGQPEVRYSCFLKEITGPPCTINGDGDDCSDEPGNIWNGSNVQYQSSTSANFTLPSNIVAGRHLKIWVSANANYAGNAIAYYIPIITEAPSPDTYEANNSQSTAYNFNPSFSGNSATVNTTGSNFHTNSDVDYYKVTLPSGYNYTITPRLHDSYNSGNGQTYTVDANFSCAVDYGSWSAGFDTYYNNNSNHNYSVSNGGTLYFKVEPYYSGNMGTYLLAVNITRSIVEVCKTPPAFDEELSNPTLDWQYRNYVTLAGGACKVYKIYLNNSTKYTFHSVPVYENYTHHRLHLYSNSGVLIASSTPNGLTQVIDHTPSSSGYVYVKMENTSSNQEIYHFGYRRMATYLIIPIVNPQGSGTTSGGGNYFEGDICTIVATANSGYSFVNWTENDMEQTNNNSYAFEVTGARNITANFSVNCVTPPNYDYSLTPTTSWQTRTGSIVANGCYVYRISVTSGQKYTFKTGCGNGATANFDTELVLYNSSGTQLAFDDDDCESSRSKIENYQFSYTGYAYLRVKGYANRYGNYTLAYRQTPTYTISTSSTPIAGGTTSGGGTFFEGELCTLSATANNNYTFTKWTENSVLVNSGSTYPFIVTGNRTLVANFTEIPTYQINTSSNPSVGGATSGGGNYISGSTCTVAATANPGYIFSNWTANGVEQSNSSSYPFEVTGARNLVANFTNT